MQRRDERTDAAVGRFEDQRIAEDRGGAGARRRGGEAAGSLDADVAIRCRYQADRQGTFGAQVDLPGEGLRAEATGFGEVEIDRPRLDDEDLVGIARVDARVVALGRGERCLVFPAEGVEIREVDHPGRVGRADAGAGEEGDVAARGVGP